jgi:cobalt-zinc-cadmium efflux system protein
MGGDHAHGTSARLRAALVANVALVVFQVGAGAAAHSVALLSDAAHNLTDVAAVGLALAAVLMARRAPTSRRSYGWVRGGVLAAQANAAVVVGLSALLLYATVQRFRSPEPVRGSLVFFAAMLAVCVNLSAAMGLRHEHDLGVRAAWLHLAGDAASSLVVAVSGLVIALTGRFQVLDPVASAVVAVVVLASGLRLLRQANAVLLEGTPSGVAPSSMESAMTAVPGVESVHDLHVWSLDGRRHAMSVHVVVAGHPTLEEAQAVATEVKRAVSAPFSIAHATVELECEGCVDDGNWCAFA